MNIEMKIVYLIIRLLGKLSVEDISNFIGEKEAKMLSSWYYEARMKVEER